MPASARHRSPWLRRGLPITLAVAFVLVALSALGVLPILGAEPADVPAIPSEPAAPPVAAPPEMERTAAPLGVAVPAAQPPTPPPSPRVDTTWLSPDVVGPLLGRAGPQLRFRVAVEQGLPISVEEFTGMVDQTLGDPRSWIAGGDIRLQRMPPTERYDFTIYLASPDTSFDLCLAGGVDIREDGVPYTSCRAGDSVVINSDRYFHGVPEYDAPLAEYQHYVINHEVGHRLGEGHELCPGPGQPAPVMQQQTLGLQGCKPNSWPYVGGERYMGPPTV